MSNKAKYKEPAIPDGRIEFTHALIEVTKLPLDAFRRANDGRKFKVKCRNRLFLLQKLASFADPDGTSCYPSIERLLDETKFSNGTLNAYLKDLESDELGFLVKGGYAWEDGPRVRRLILPVGKRAGLQDSKQDSSIHNSGLQDSTSGFQYSKSRIPVQTGNNLPVVDLPEKNLPPQDLSAAGAGFLLNTNATGKEKVKEYAQLARKTFTEHLKELECGTFTLTTRQAESLFIGRDPEAVDLALMTYLNRRNWKGLVCPQKMLLDEFADAYEDYLEELAEDERKQKECAEANRQIAEMNAKAKEDYEKLHAKREEQSQAVPVSDPSGPDWNTHGSDITIEEWVHAANRLDHDNEYIMKHTGLTVADIAKILNNPTFHVPMSASGEI